MTQIQSNFRLSPLEERITRLYREKRINKPADITLFVFDSEANIEVIHRPGDTHKMQIMGQHRIFLDSRKLLPQRRVEMAHEIGHILLHSGNQAWMASDCRQKQEWQANRFAMYALVPSQMLIQSVSKNICDDAFICDLALEYGVTCKFMSERLELLKEDMKL